MRSACRDVQFGDEDGRDLNQVWLDYNADLLAWEEEQKRRRAESQKTAKAAIPVMVCPENATMEEKIAFKKMQKQMEAMARMVSHPHRIIICICKLCSMHLRRYLRWMHACSCVLRPRTKS